MSNDLSSRIRFENTLFDSITEHFEGTGMPQTILVAISPDRETVIVMGSYGNVCTDWPTPDWNVEEIDSDNLSDNISEVASFYFDPRYFNC